MLIATSGRVVKSRPEPRRPEGFDREILDIVIRDLCKAGPWGRALVHQHIRLLDNQCRRPERMEAPTLRRLLAYTIHLEKTESPHRNLKLLTAQRIGRETRREVREALGIPW